jgi:ATP-binding cassette subfamily B protein/ATP-binding cassette subfamily C protein
LLVSYLGPQWPRVTLLAGLLLGSIGLQLYNPQVMRRFIDTIGSAAPAVQPGAVNDLFSIGLLFFAIAVAQQLLGVSAAYVGENVAWIATNALRLDLAGHCLRLDMSFHSTRTPGEMIERLDGDVGALSHFFSQFSVRIISNTLLLAGALVLLFREDWRVGLALTGFASISLAILWRLKNVSVPYWKAWRQAAAELYGFLEERLAGTEDIRACGAKAYVMGRFYRLTQALLDKALKAGMVNNVLFNATHILFAAGNAIAFAVGAWLFRENILTIGAVYIIFHYSTMLSAPIQGLAHESQNLQSAGGSVVRIHELFQTQSKLQAVAGGAPRGRATLAQGALAVAFQDVSFSYSLASENASSAGRPVLHSPGTPGHEHHVRAGRGSNGKSLPTPPRPPGNGPAGVLHDLSFELKPGHLLGLLGRTGSGKTTLARLIFRLYDPDRGAICLGHNGQLPDIRSLPLEELRQRIGLVTQNVQLFNASVYDNLTFFDRSVPEEKIVRVLDELGLGDWYQALPQGLASELASGGDLSAGEAQLLAFARIFLQDPGLIILDEASSRLDLATERRVERAVDRLLQGRTAIIIAHRLSTIQRVDEIMIMDGGRICEHGARSALASDPGSQFYSLLQTGLEEVLA